MRVVPGVRHPEILGYDADHMRERLRLFVILLLGEAVLQAGLVTTSSPSMTTSTDPIWSVRLGMSDRRDAISCTSTPHSRRH